MDEIDRLISDLEAIEERMMDLSMQILSDAIEAGSNERPQLEKRVSQARRSVAKAKEHLKINSD